MTVHNFKRKTKGRPPHEIEVVKITLHEIIKLLQNKYVRGTDVALELIDVGLRKSDLKPIIHELMKLQ
jgi:hypothetical protein|tara:strand:+ start:8722 stop:8925 length:204 start_codon:yes stop_codon:yes gene_type:complete